LDPEVIDIAGATMARFETTEFALRRDFLGWQCRIRQRAVRHDDGRPSAGMRPEVLMRDQTEALGRIIVLIVKNRAGEFASRFRFMASKTNDPADRRDSALRFLAAGYYQKPDEFSDELTALFAPRSGLADHLLAARRCVLVFEQYGQRYRLPCAVRDLPENDSAYQVTYWHNSLFNPAIPGGIQILGFRPDWPAARATPG